MGKRGAPPEVNAGSMADIAFLLLIFFLVTTTIQTDQGLTRKLPPLDKNETPSLPVKEKNVFTVVINRYGQLLVENKELPLKELRKAAIDFLDNNGDGTCKHCMGKRDINLSDNPEKAIISLINDNETKYEDYIAVQNELVAAYYTLRDRESKKLYSGKTYKELEDKFNDPATKDEMKEKLQPVVESIQKLYPQNLSEAEAKRE
ncbi:MAG: ExbD/TolR family protein [Flavobacterium sp.]